MEEKLKLKLDEINKKAAENTSKAMTKLIEKEAGVKILKADIVDVKELKPAIKSEDLVAGIYLPITGVASGAALVVFPKDDAFVLCDVLLEKADGTTRSLKKLDEAALMEAGNIICGSYFTVLSNALQVRIIENVPNFSFTMYGSILEQIVTKFVKKAEKALVIEVGIDVTEHAVKGYFILMFEIENLEAILATLC